MKPRALWTLSALFILYATTLPFQFDPSVSNAAAKLTRLPIDPFERPEGGRPSLPDMLQNVLLFMPFGALGMLGLRPRRSRRSSLLVQEPGPRAGVGALAFVTIAGCLLAVCVESLQLFTSDRVSSFNDVVTNTCGALMGGITVLVLAPPLQEISRRMDVAVSPSARTALRATFVAAMLLAVAAWHPFDASLDVGGFVSKVRTLIADPWQTGSVNDQGVDLLRYALFGGAVAVLLRRGEALWPRATAAFLAAAAALALELSQLLIGARMPGLSDAMIGVVGGCVGAWLGPRMERASPSVCAGAVIAAAWIAAAVMTFSPFDLAGERSSFGWTPFLSYYRYTSGQTVSHVLELMMAFFPIGFVLIAARRSMRWQGIAVIAVVLASMLEYLQGWMVGRYSDMTDVLMMTLGAVIGAWTAKAFVLRD